MTIATSQKRRKILPKSEDQQQTAAVSTVHITPAIPATPRGSAKPKSEAAKQAENGSTPSKTPSRKTPKKLRESLITADDLPAMRAKAARIAVILDVLYDNPPCPLDYDTPFQLLVAVILSAQVTTAPKTSKIGRILFSNGQIGHQLQLALMRHHVELQPCMHACSKSHTQCCAYTANSGAIEFWCHSCILIPESNWAAWNTAIIQISLLLQAQLCHQLGANDGFWTSGQWLANGKSDLPK